MGLPEILEDHLEDEAVAKIIETRANAKMVGGEKLIEGVSTELKAMGLL